MKNNFIFVDWANNHIRPDLEFDTLDEGVEKAEELFGEDALEDLYIVLKSEYTPNFSKHNYFEGRIR